MFQMFSMMLILFNTLLFSQMTHPMTMGLSLLFQTLFICLFTGLMKTFWYSYILFLIFIGGMLILFIYMSSLSPNEKIKFSPSLFLFLMILIMFLFIDKFYTYYPSINENMFNFNTLLFNSLTLSKIYNYPNNYITLLMILYLLLTLIVVVKISNSFMGPLRSKN